MGQFLAYSLQSAICLAMFYLFFKVLLSRETFHRFNRVALLSILALSLILPLTLALANTIMTPVGYSEFADSSSELSTQSNANANTEDSTIGSGNIYLSILLLTYLSGCAVCLIYSGILFTHIVMAIRKGEYIKTVNGTKIIISENKKTPPFSWMNYIVISRHDYEEAGTTIITHENAHISLHHTYDLLIAQTCIIMQWFNPAAWLLYQELQSIHEYEADEKVLRQGVDARQYQLLLIKKAVGSQLYSMANSFNHSNLKKRITMMLQKKSNSWARLKYAYVLPLAAITVAAFAHPKISQQFEEISSAKVSHFLEDYNLNDEKNLLSEESPQQPANIEATNNPIEADISVRQQGSVAQEDTTVFVHVDNMPEYPGGDIALMKYLNSIMIYPENAKKNNISGTVYCQFIVNKDGSVSDVEVLREVHPELDNEAIRVLKTLTKFKPGTQRGQIVRVKYQTRIRFQYK